MTIIAVNEEELPKHHIPRGMAAVVSGPELPLSDVLLIVEDLLMQTRALVHSGAPAGVIEATLDRVAALREGRG